MRSNAVKIQHRHRQQFLRFRFRLRQLQPNDDNDDKKWKLGATRNNSNWLTELFLKLGITVSNIDR